MRCPRVSMFFIVSLSAAPTGCGVTAAADSDITCQSNSGQCCDLSCMSLKRLYLKYGFLLNGALFSYGCETGEHFLCAVKFFT